jgi:predicted nucleotidyltransferase
MPHPTLTTDVASQYAERLASLLGQDLLRVSLFGSRARGEARPRSDFDLMVVLRRASGENRDVVHGLATEIELEHGIDLSTKITDEERFERLKRSALLFWRHFNRDEEVLWPRTSSPSD